MDATMWEQVKVAAARWPANQVYVGGRVFTIAEAVAMVDERDALANAVLEAVLIASAPRAP